MPSGRGLVTLAAALGLWLGARLVGSPTLHVVAVGVAVLPFAAAWFGRRANRQLAIRRRIDRPRVAVGQRVTVELEVENRSPASTSFLLLEDRFPSTLGRSARLVLAGVPAQRSQVARYTVVPPTRGRYTLGPLVVEPADPFALTRRRIEFRIRDELIVTPQVERLAEDPDARSGTPTGVSRARRLLRTGEEFFTMRQYQTGDDLRRIHWPSVARTGELMIRQDESSRRARGVLLLDTREGALGASRSPGFERAVSVAASIGVLMLRSGFSLRLALGETQVLLVTEEQLLDTLAGVAHHTSRAISPALTRLRREASPDATLVVVTGPPAPPELTSIIRAGAAFGPRLAVLVQPTDPATAPSGRAEFVRDRAESGRLSLARSGWDVLVLTPSMRLRDAWQTIRAPRPAATG
ncbi:MAG TPA: DUF58 domain-containing protein [Actinomycetota bacterium]|nr:DUF58 domain-containing protein [Actinomycetota bacterium]